MKQLIFTLIAFLGFTSCGHSDNYEPKNGDIIFHTSRSAQSLAIQRATKSRYSHMGIVYIKGGKPVVFEAVGPVKSTPLESWVARGEGGRYIVKRLPNVDKVLTPQALRRMQAVGKTFEGKPYDLYFEWSDDRIYCSELVWKIYKRALNMEIGRLQTIDEFDLTNPLVRAKIRERFGNKLPKGEQVISPAAIFESNFLITVFEK